jgi:alpha-glucoside transport system substrate-binding protein
MRNTSLKFWPSIGLAAALVTLACGTQTTSSGKIGGTVHVLAVWSGSEQASFEAVLKPFEDQTGIKVLYEATRDQDAILTTRVEAGNPPDLASAPSPSLLARFVREGKILPLDQILDLNKLRSDYDKSWIDLGTINGKLYEIFSWTALKGLVWYDPKVWSAKGYQVPKTWDDLIALQNKMKQDGTTPWCIGLESGSASGWPGKDWMEEIVLTQAGPTVYDSWWQGKQKWSSPEIKQAWQTWGTILGPNDSNVYGGKNNMLATNFGDGGTPMFANPPKCFMHYQASFITDFFVKAVPTLKAGEDFTFFPIPDVNSQNAGAHVVAGDTFSVFKDTPQSRALIQYLATAEAQAIWVKRGGKLSANKQLSISNYPDDISKSLADALVKTKTAKFDAGDLMPSDMGTNFWKAALAFVSNQGNLDSILANLDKIQQTAYT